VAVVRPDRPNVEAILRKIYELYADYVVKNPFYTPDMPIRCERFDTALAKLVRIEIPR
jgi:trafficking protein particle complex subunit 4